VKETRLRKALERGYLVLGPQDRDPKLLHRWWECCRAEGLLISMEVHRRCEPWEVTIRPLSPRLSTQAINELSLLAKWGDGSWTANNCPATFKLQARRTRELTKIRRCVADVMQREHLRQELNAGCFPIEGLAVCVDNEGLEHKLHVGQRVYVRELPNFQGHCLMLSEGGTLIGIHLDRFRMADADTLPRSGRRSYGFMPAPWPAAHRFWLLLEGSQRWSDFAGRAPD